MAAGAARPLLLSADFPLTFPLLVLKNTDSYTPTHTHTLARCPVLGQSYLHNCPSQTVRHDQRVKLSLKKKSVRVEKNDEEEAEEDIDR